MELFIFEDECVTLLLSNIKTQTLYKNESRTGLLFSPSNFTLNVITNYRNYYSYHT